MQTFTVLLLVACSALNGWKEYVDHALGFKFKHPKTWEMKTEDKLVVFLAPKENDNDEFRENINMLTVDLAKQPMELDEFTTTTLQVLKQHIGDSVTVSVKDITVAGHPGKEIIYTLNLGRMMKIKQHATVANTMAYIFTYTAELEKFEQYESIATEAMQSLKLF